METTQITKKERIQDVDGIFQFVIMVSIFLLTFIDNLFKLGGSNIEEASLTQLQWANVPIGLVVGYVVFRLFRFKFRDWVIKVTNILLFSEIISIILAITVVLQYKNAITSYVAYYLMKVALFLSITIPTVIFALLLLSLVYYFTKESKPIN